MEENLVEIVEFYPGKKVKKKVIGTLHVYIPEIDLDIRGITVKQHAKGLFMLMPCRITIDEETNEKVVFPIFGMSNSEKFKKIVKQIAEKGQDYIFKNFSGKNVLVNKQKG